MTDMVSMVQLSTKEGVLSSAPPRARTRAVRAAAAFRMYGQEAMSAAVSVGAVSSGAMGRRSIRPVTAAAIRAVRRSRRSRVDWRESAINSSIAADLAVIECRIACCSSAGGIGIGSYMMFVDDIDARFVLCLDLDMK